MDIARVNDLLVQVQLKLESLDPANLERLQEAQKTPSEQNPSRLSAAKKRLQRLYDKNTKGRPDSTKVKATGSKR